MNTTGFKGKISAEFSSQQLHDLCQRHIPGIDLNRFKIIAIRVFAGKEFIVTVFASDTLKETEGQQLPVKKFKIETLSHAEFFNYVYGYNFTLSENNLSMNDLQVINR